MYKLRDICTLVQKLSHFEIFRQNICILAIIIILIMLSSLFLDDFRRAVGIFQSGDDPTNGENLMKLLHYFETQNPKKLREIKFNRVQVGELWRIVLISPVSYRKSENYTDERAKHEVVAGNLIRMTDRLSFSGTGYNQLIPIKVFDGVLQRLFVEYGSMKRDYWIIIETFVRYVHQKSVMFNLHVFQHGIQTEDLAVMLMCLELTGNRKPVVAALYAGGVARLPTSVKDWFQLKEGEPVKTSDELIYVGGAAFRQDDFYFGANNPCNLTLEDI
jgi:hypothetical protein